MTRLDRLSESQANAEAIARRDSAYLTEHYGSRGRRDARGRPLPQPRGLVALLHWYELEWYDQAPDELHRRDLWREYVAANEQWARRGGGSALGTHAWSEGMRRILEAPRSADADGSYVHPLAAAMVAIERRNAYMAAYLRAIALAGFEVYPIGIRMGWDPSVSIVYGIESLGSLWRAYRIDVPARVLPHGVASPATDDLSPTALSGAGASPLPAKDGARRLTPTPA